MTFFDPQRPGIDFNPLTDEELLLIQNLGSLAWQDGDMIYYDNGQFQRLAIGSNDEVLKVVAGLPSWEAGAGSDTFAIIQVDGVAVSTGAPTLDLDGTDFVVTESPTDDFDITINPERIQDIVGAMVTGNTETNISVTYQDADGTFDFEVADAFILNTGDTGTGVYDFGGADSFEIPNSDAPTVNANGEIALDNSVADFSHGILKYFGGEEMGVVAMPIAEFGTPSDGFVVAYNATNDEFELVEAATGSGDVTKVGTPLDNQMAVWTGDGTLEGTSDFTYDGTNLNLITGKNFQIAGGTVLSDSAGTLTLSGIDALDPTTEATIEAAIDTLANLVSIQGRTVTLADAGANAFFGWDDTAGAYENLTAAEAEAIIEPLIDTLANLTSVQGRTITLADAGADAIFGWDDSASAYENLTQAEVLAIIGDASTIAKGVSELATQAETNAGSDTTRTVTPNGLALATRSIMLLAAGGAPTTTAGCSDPTKVEAGTNDIDYWVMDFDTTTEEHAFWTFPMPDNYGGGTVTAIFYWTAAGGSTVAETVVWGIKGRSYGNDEAIDQATGTEQTVTDNWLANGDVHISSATSAMTFAGTPAGGELVQVIVSRKTASDNLAGDARLIGVKIEYVINAYSD